MSYLWTEGGFARSPPSRTRMPFSRSARADVVGSATRARIVPDTDPQDGVGRRGAAGSVGYGGGLRDERRRAGLLAGPAAGGTGPAAPRPGGARAGPARDRRRFAAGHA